MIASLSLLFNALSAVFCLHYLYGEKVRWDIITVSFISIDLIIMYMINCFDMDKNWSLLIYPIIMLYCILKFGKDIKAVIVNNILYLLIVCALQMLLVIPICVIFKTKTFGTKEILINNIVTFLIIIGIFKKCKLHIVSKYLQDKERLITIALIVATGGLFFALIRFNGGNWADAGVYIILSVGIALICSIAARLGKYKIGLTEAETELRTYKLYEGSFKNLIEEVRARQHEFDNHINVVRNSTLLCNTYDELVKTQQDYFNEVQKENRYNKLLSAGNSMLIGFLYGKCMEAEKCGIQVTYKIAINELECGIPVHKLVELTGNLINNAIEELKKSSAERSLFIKIIETEKAVEIEVGNVTESIDYDMIQKFFKKGYSSKGEGRGYGLYNVKKICDAYGMEIECKNEEMEGENYLLFRITKEKEQLVK